jgi:ribosomal protein S12 methylthiotransferase accessory factor
MGAFVDHSAREARSERACFPEPIKALTGWNIQPHGWPFARSAPKAAGGGLHRIVKPEATFERIQPFFSRVGITRIADITGLDRIGIPVYSAIVPRSRDVISVYNGKGFTAMDAKTGAVMEAVERFAASRDRLPDDVASYRELSRHAPVIDPRSVNTPLHPNYTDDTPVAWLKGIDLLSGHTVLVPHGLACFYGLSYPWQSCHAVTSTNGLAAGNSLEEAACHALAEVIERDAHSIMDVIARQVLVVGNQSPWLRQTRVEQLNRERRLLYPAIDLDRLPDRATHLVQRFRAAGVEPLLQYAGSECGAVTIVCLVHEDITAKFSQAHHGLGTDPDPTVAVVRALTEAAQSRAIDIQALREDLTAVGVHVEQHMQHANRSGVVNKDYWFSNSHSIPLSSIKGHSTADIMDDIHIMLDGLRAEGIEHCVMVDLSVAEIPAKVVRIIAPGLESWIVDHGKVGKRAKAHWRELAARVR